MRGDQVDYNGSPAGYADQPDEVVTYVDAHDNETLWDALTYKLPPATPMADRVRMNTVSMATVALAQTPAFFHAGSDLLRSKSLDRNSYDSGDWFNHLGWPGAGVDNGFGRGLPPKADNESKWPYAKPLLADPALKPSADDVATATAAAQDLLRLRFSSPLFRLGSAAEITQRVSFPLGRPGPDPRRGRHADLRHRRRGPGPDGEEPARRPQRLAEGDDPDRGRPGGARWPSHRCSRPGPTRWSGRRPGTQAAAR